MKKRKPDKLNAVAQERELYNAAFYRIKMSGHTFKTLPGENLPLADYFREGLLLVAPICLTSPYSTTSVI